MYMSRTARLPYLLRGTHPYTHLDNGYAGIKENALYTIVPRSRKMHYIQLFPGVGAKRRLALCRLAWWGQSAEPAALERIHHYECPRHHFEMNDSSLRMPTSSFWNEWFVIMNAHVIILKWMIHQFLPAASARYPPGRLKIISFQARFLESLLKNLHFCMKNARRPRASWWSWRQGTGTASWCWTRCAWTAPSPRAPCCGCSYSPGSPETMTHHLKIHHV